MWRLVARMGLTSLMLVVIIQAQSDEPNSLDPFSLKETMEIVETWFKCKAKCGKHFHPTSQAHVYCFEKCLESRFREQERLQRQNRLFFFFLITCNALLKKQRTGGIICLT